jgi:hypothetical protein
MQKYLTILAILCLAIGCSDSITVIKGCCDDPPVNVTFGNGKIYVPNVFTPNGDGVNDKLVIYADSVRQIVSLKIRNKEGIVVYYNLHLPVNDTNSAWDGTSVNSIERGMYSFEMVVEAEDYTKVTIKGKVCNCPCDQEADEDIAPIAGCKFGLCTPEWIDCQMIEALSCFKQ